MEDSIEFNFCQKAAPIILKYASELILFFFNFLTRPRYVENEDLVICLTI